METFVINNLDNSMAEIRGFAIGLLYGTTTDTVTFAVRYPEGDQDRDGELSLPDILTVNRDLEVVTATSE